MLLYCHSEDFDDTDTRVVLEQVTCASLNPVPVRLAINALVFAIAAKYSIPKLGKAAWDKFMSLQGLPPAAAAKAVFDQKSPPNTFPDLRGEISLRCGLRIHDVLKSHDYYQLLANHSGMCLEVLNASISRFDAKRINLEAQHNKDVKFWQHITFQLYFFLWGLPYGGLPFTTRP